MRALSDKIVFDGQFIQVLDREFRNRVGGAGHWEVVRRKTHGKIVAIVPITSEGEVILVRIYRVPSKAWVLEISAGLSDQPNESSEDLAKRECLEETGYQVDRIEKIMEGPFNAGLLADELIVFLGYGARKVQEQQLEDSEAIEVVKVPIKELRSFLLHPPEDTLVDIKLFGLLPFLGKIQ